MSASPTTGRPDPLADDGLAVVVTAAGQPVLVVDAAGRILAPETSAERAEVAVALARASAALAVLPAPGNYEQAISGVIATLNSIGTPSAADAIDALSAAAEVTTAALQRATAVMAAAVPTATGKH